MGKKPVIRLLLLLIAGSLLLVACSVIRVTGKYPSQKESAVFSRLPNYENDSFRNKYPRIDSLNKDTVPAKAFRKERSHRFKKPKLSKEIPHVKINLHDTSFAAPTVVWFGHSSCLIQSEEFRILIDPVFSGYGSPIWFVNRNMDGSNVYQTEDLPHIDLLLLTHDHYDHMDYKTMKKYRKTAGRVVVPLGVGRTLDYWGYKPEQFQQVNWGDSIRIADHILLVSAPAQHFSGRFTERNRTLWTSYVLEIHGYRIFIGGDGGYNRHFKDIGDTYGPFDLALLENGQYSPYWPASHCYPEQTAQAAVDLQAKMVLPIHWAKFSAAYHTWNDPIKRLLPAIDSLGIPITVPRIGEPYTIGDPPKRDVWWNFE